MLKSSFKESPMISPNPKSVLDTGYTSRKEEEKDEKKDSNTLRVNCSKEEHRWSILPTLQD